MRTCGFERVAQHEQEQDRRSCRPADRGRLTRSHEQASYRSQRWRSAIVVRRHHFRCSTFSTVIVGQFLPPAPRTGAAFVCSRDALDYPIQCTLTNPLRMAQRLRFTTPRYPRTVATIHRVLRQAAPVSRYGTLRSRGSWDEEVNCCSTAKNCSWDVIASESTARRTEPPDCPFRIPLPASTSGALRRASLILLSCGSARQRRHHAPSPLRSRRTPKAARGGATARE